MEEERIRQILIDLNASENHARAAHKALDELAASERRWEPLLWEVNILLEDFMRLHKELPKGRSTPMHTKERP